MKRAAPGRAAARASPAATTVNDCWNRIGVRGDGSCPELKQHVHCRNCPVFAAAAALQLDAALPGDHLATWTRHVAQAQQTQATGTESVLLFRLGAEWLALPTALFDEVTERRPVHSLPHRGGGIVLGLVNVRGELLVCVSLGALLGLLEAAPTEPASGERTVHARMLVLRHENTRVVFPVDEVQGIHRFNPRDAREPPASVARAPVTYARAVLPWRDQTVGLLDAGLVGYTLQRRLSSASAT